MLAAWASGAGPGLELLPLVGVGDFPLLCNHPPLLLQPRHPQVGGEAGLLPLFPQAELPWPSVSHTHHKHPGCALAMGADLDAQDKEGAPLLVMFPPFHEDLLW